MKITLSKKNDGVAIFIVLVSVLVLSGMAIVFARSMKVEIKLAMNSNNETDMEWIGRSGVEYARWILAQELTTVGPGQRYTALSQKWANGVSDTNDVFAGVSLTDVPLGNGSFSLKITDNERKFNINTTAFNEQIMNQSLILIGADASEIPGIIASIQDWIDPDEDTHVNGAESEYYQSLTPPYFAKNAPIDDLSELLLIKGISSDIYWGPNSTNHTPSQFQQKPQISTAGQTPASLVSAGLVDIFTSISSGLVNINTCSANTLRMIGMDEASANRIISQRQGPDGVDGTEDDAPFSNPTDIVNAGVPNQLVSQFSQFLTVQSSTFDIQVDVQVGQSKRTYHALVRRNSPRDIQVLSMHWD